MPWLTKLKIAIAEQNTMGIDKLISEVPKFDTIEEMKEAQYLFKEVSVLLHSLKDKTQVSMQQIQKNLDFMRATQASPTGKLDIKS